MGSSSSKSANEFEKIHGTFYQNFTSFILALEKRGTLAKIHNINDRNKIEELFNIIRKLGDVSDCEASYYMVVGVPFLLDKDSVYSKTHLLVTDNIKNVRLTEKYVNNLNTSNSETQKLSFLQHKLKISTVKKRIINKVNKTILNNIDRFEKEIDRVITGTKGGFKKKASSH